MEDYHLWIRMYAAGYQLTSLQESLYLFKMDSDTFQRRGGKQYVKSEYQIQRLLLSNRIISYPRLNVACFTDSSTKPCGGRKSLV